MGQARRVTVRGSRALRALCTIVMGTNSVNCPGSSHLSLQNHKQPRQTAFGAFPLSGGAIFVNYILKFYHVSVPRQPKTEDRGYSKQNRLLHCASSEPRKSGWGEGAGGWEGGGGGGGGGYDGCVVDLTSCPLNPFLTGRMFLAEHTSDTSTNYDSFLN